MIHTHFHRALALALTLVILPPPRIATAGTEIAPGPKDKVIEPVKKELPLGMVTFGGEFSENLSTFSTDSLTPFWGPGDFVVYLDTRNKWTDNGQSLSSYGLATRYLVPDHDIILGVNGFYDALESRHGNNFDQLGIGAELLTRWFDARANWYLPEGTRYEIERSTSRESESTRVGNFRSGAFFSRRDSETEVKTFSKRYEGALEGYNMEAGFLVPGLDKYFELRFLAGYYNYSGPYDKNFDGFKARAEARILPGLIANVEYWEDAFLMGGNWTGDVRVSIPFSLFNLAKGRNPFEGISDMFRPRQREFRERLSDQILRSHVVQTSDSDPVGSGGNSTSSTTDTPIAPVPTGNKKKPSAPTPPPTRTPTFAPSKAPDRGAFARQHANLPPPNLL